MRPRELVVGLAGPAGVGKSTLAARLTATVAPVAVRRMSFADPLRDMLRALGVPETAIVGDLRAKERPCDELLGQTGRHAMRTLGTEWGRKTIHPDLWVAAWERRLAETLESVVVIDDVRFDNEAAAIRRAGGVVIRLRRALTTTPLAAAIPDEHPSEAGVSDDLVDADLDLGVGHVRGCSDAVGDVLAGTLVVLESSPTEAGGPECGTLLDRLRDACALRRAAMQRAGWVAFLAAAGRPGRDLLVRLAGVIDCAPGADVTRDVALDEVRELFAALDMPWGGGLAHRRRQVEPRAVTTVDEG